MALTACIMNLKNTEFSCLSNLLRTQKPASDPIRSSVHLALLSLTCNSSPGSQAKVLPFSCYLIPLATYFKDCIWNLLNAMHVLYYLARAFFFTGTIRCGGLLELSLLTFGPHLKQQNGWKHKFQHRRVTSSWSLAYN